jgi:glycosyltransferase involved in cell wall biosynthesis
MLRLLVVSHPAVLAVNQLPYAELRRHGWDPFIVAPARWRHEYADDAFPPEVFAGLEGRVAGRRIALPGRVQRHFYVTAVPRLIARIAPRAAFLEQEPTSASGFQWGVALHRAGIPFGLQADENLERPLPLPARAFRRWTLAHAAFVAARSPTAAELVHRVSPKIPTPLIPHHVPGWAAPARAPRDAFVIGYAGRLVPEKGLDVLLDAAAKVSGSMVRFVGNGPLRADLESRASRQGVALEIDANVRHGEMARAYASFDVLVLPSRTTRTWAEQFGRVLVEALSCGVPVVGSDSGEIAWVIGTTGGGLVVPEGDPEALAAALVRLRDDPALRRELAARGGARAQELFSVPAVATALDHVLRSASGTPTGDGSSDAQSAVTGAPQGWPTSA